MPALDSLRVLALDRLVLHEAHDEARLGRLRQAMEEEGFQRNPVIVAPLPGDPTDGRGRYLVLDGAHRSHALAGMGIPLALVQVVALPERADGWGHLIPHSNGLEERLRSLDDVEAGPVPLRDRLGDDRFLAEVAFHDGGSLPLRVRDEGVGPVVKGLWSLRGAYPDGGRYRRVRPGEPVGAGEAVISYRRFTPAELVAVVEGGGVLPAGVTRFVVGERVLNVRLSLAMLREGDAGRANAELGRLVHAAREADRIRYYGEPVVLFE